MLWVKFVSDAGQGVTAKMNLTQFIFAMHKCILARVAMKNCAKRTYVKSHHLVIQNKLGFLEGNVISANACPKLETDFPAGQVRLLS